MYGVDWISRSSTIAKCWTFGGGFPWLQSPPRAPRCASLRVISWKAFLPLLVNCISTTGSFVWVSMSARVPESFSWSPVISGIGLFGKSFTSWCLRR